MAVYKRTYSSYQGSLTPSWSRFFIPIRYSYAELWNMRLLIMFRIAALFYPVGCVAYLYGAHNLSFLTSLRVPGTNLIEITPKFFLYYCYVQGALAYILTAFVGPTLVSPDLVNNAMPLYFCRPFSRTEYIVGKMGVLVSMLSLITWIPGLILFVIQASLAGWTWTTQNLWIAWGLFFGLMVWILVLSLLALALSAWVKWKIAAGGLVLGVFFVGAGFGSALNAVARTKYGTLLNLPQVIYTVWMQLFRYDPDTGISVQAAWICLAVVCAFC